MYFSEKMPSIKDNYSWLDDCGKSEALLLFCSSLCLKSPYVLLPLAAGAEAQHDIYKAQCCFFLLYNQDLNKL